MREPKRTSKGQSQPDAPVEKEAHDSIRQKGWSFVGHLSAFLLASISKWKNGGGSLNLNGGTVTVPGPQHCAESWVSLLQCLHHLRVCFLFTTSPVV